MDYKGDYGPLFLFLYNRANHTILAEKTTPLEISQDIAPSNFKIQTSRKAFEILSKGLYSNNIQSIVREISTNAYDSHVMAKKETVPFTVHLPNAFEPYFAVRDDGVGLSDEEINSIYTTYFDSNKNKSNDYTGCLGLGSKSPFSYTEQFTIESRYNGEKTLYAAFINSVGIPCISKMGDSQKTKECNGVEIKFAVKKEDFSKFRSEAEHVLQWFKTRPNIAGQTATFPNYVHILANANYALLKTQTGYSYVVMGNVAYPITYNTLSHEIRSKFSVQEQTILNHGCLLYLQIGSVDIAANRESINFDDNTIAVLKKYLSEIIKDSKKHIEDSIKNATTALEARLALAEYKNTTLSNIHTGHKFLWKGKEVAAFLNIPKDISAYSISCNRYSKRKWSSYKESGFNIKRENAYYLNDIKGGLERIQYSLEGNTNVGSYGYGNTLHFYFQDCQELDKFLKEEGLDKVIKKASDLPEVPRAVTVSKAKEFSKVYKFNEDKTGGANRDYWNIEENLEDDAVYVEIYRFFVTNYWDKDDKQGLRPNVIRDLCNKLKAIKKHKPIYGIRPTDVAAVKKKFPKWKPMNEYVNTLFSPTILEKLKYKKQSYSLPWQYSYLHSLKIPKTTKLYDLQQLIHQSQKYSNNKILQTYEQIASQCNMEIKATNDISDIIQELDKKYPLIHHITVSHDNLNDILQYIKAIDKL